MNKASELPFEACLVCRKRLVQKATGRFRKTCSDACRQKRHRERKGQLGWDVRRKKKAHAKRRALPMTEKAFIYPPEPVLRFGERRALYECFACGEPFLVERIRATMKVNPYCSKHCENKARWEDGKFQDAFERAHQCGELDPRVRERFEQHKSSPLCAHCGKPFMPNVTEEGYRKPGRPKKYCSDRCCKEAYEAKWRTQHRGKARGHRYKECVECGEVFDALTEAGQRIGRFCSAQCNGRFKIRAYRAREKAKETGRRVVNGYWIAAKNASKRRGKTGIRYGLAGDLSGEQVQGIVETMALETTGGDSGIRDDLKTVSSGREKYKGSAKKRIKKQRVEKQEGYRDTKGFGFGIASI